LSKLLYIIERLIQLTHLSQTYSHKTHSIVSTEHHQCVIKRIA